MTWYEGYQCKIKGQRWVQACTEVREVDREREREIERRGGL